MTDAGPPGGFGNAGLKGLLIADPLMRREKEGFL